MKEIICVFVKSGDHPAVENLIEKVQKSPYTHAALECGADTAVAYPNQGFVHMDMRGYRAEWE